LPQGTWTNFLTGEQVNGGSWKKEYHDYESIPLFVRPNSVIALGHIDNKPDYDYANEVDFQVFELEEGRSAVTTVYSENGKAEVAFTAARETGVISIQVEGATKPYTVTLRGVNEVTSVRGASVEINSNGVRLLPTSENATIEVTL
jgi:alpha-D-xyloside xylohydrolase